MKVLSHTTHGIVDYATVAMFALAPTILGFAGLAAIVSYALAVIHFLMTALTGMPLGIFEIIPFKLHATVELLVGPTLIAGAWTLPSIFAGGQIFFTIAGAAILLVWVSSE